MNYIYLILGVVLGIVFIGRGKNARNKKFVPYEVKTVTFADGKLKESDLFLI